MRSCLVWLAWLLGCVGVAGSAHAQSAAESAPSGASTAEPSAPDQDVERARRARQEFRAGVEHFQAGRYVESIHAFRVAASLIPSADLWFNIASAYEQLARIRGEPSDYEQAILHYRRYLTERVDPPDRAAVESNIAALSERLEAVRAARTVLPSEGTVRLRSDFEGALVRVDGEAVGQTPIDREIELTPGSHRIEASRDGYLPFVADVDVERGGVVLTRIDLGSALTHRSVAQTPVVTWFAWGLAAATLVATVAVGVHAQSLVPVEFGATDGYAAARDWGAISDALLGTTIGLTTLGIALYVFESRAVGTVSERGGATLPP